MVAKETVEICIVVKVNVPGPGYSTKCPRALGIRTLHDCASQMNETLMISNSKYLETLIIKFEFICERQPCWVCII